MRANGALARRFALAVLVGLGGMLALSIGDAWANPDPAEPQEQPQQPSQPSPPADETPAPPPPAGEPFIPPGEQTPAPVAPVDPATPVPPDGSAPVDGTQAPAETDPTTVASPSSDSSPSPASRAAGAGVVAVGAGAAAAGGMFGRRPGETDDEYKRRMLGGVAWAAAGTVIFVAKGVTLATVLAGGGCLVVAGIILWWGAPARAKVEPAPAGPPVDLQSHIDKAQDHNLLLNESGTRTQSQGVKNPVDDEFKAP